MKPNQFPWMEATARGEGTSSAPGYSQKKMDSGNRCPIHHQGEGFRPALSIDRPFEKRGHLLREAKQFIQTCYRELGKPEEEIDFRLGEIKREIQEYGHYNHTFEELKHGAKMAWRNSNRCIGRLFWNSLQVFDARHLRREEDIFRALCRHIIAATNDGKIKPTITIFKPVIQGLQQTRIWNHQLIRYAGYETEYGTVGDPASIPFTRHCQSLGWEGEGTHFDLLPLVIQAGEQNPRWFELPKEIILEVPIHHPRYPWFADLGIQWYAVPIISDMRLEIGGIQYTAAPFNGWYMGTEIGARNLADTDRYNLLPLVAERMGLSTRSLSTLWKDQALLELNIAVLHSYKEASVSIVDHHTAAQQFKRFEDIERKSGRNVTGDWTWLIPPISPAATHIFHQQYPDEILTPNYFYQDPPYP